MKLTTTAFSDMGIIPPEFAFGAIDPTTHVKLSTNRNPDFAWSALPSGVQSLALIWYFVGRPAADARAETAL